MKKVLLTAMVILVLIGLGCLAYGGYFGFLVGDNGWYDKDTRIGWNCCDQWYYVTECASDFPEEYRIANGIKEDHMIKVTHLDEKTRDYLMRQGRRSY